MKTAIEKLDDTELNGRRVRLVEDRRGGRSGTLYPFIEFRLRLTNESMNFLQVDVVDDPVRQADRHAVVRVPVDVLVHARAVHRTAAPSHAAAPSLVDAPSQSRQSPDPDRNRRNFTANHKSRNQMISLTPTFLCFAAIAISRNLNRSHVRVRHVIHGPDHDRSTNPDLETVLVRVHVQKIASLDRFRQRITAALARQRETKASMIKFTLTIKNQF